MKLGNAQLSNKSFFLTKENGIAFKLSNVIYKYKDDFVLRKYNQDLIEMSKISFDFYEKDNHY